MKRYALSGRAKPYTDSGIKRLPCFRCGAPATSQWQICSDENLYRPICTTCDMLLNYMVLRFMKFPSNEIREKMIAYRLSKK